MKYSDLQVWQLSMDLVEDIYKLTAGFPAKEQFCLCNQIQRAAISIPSNIAEGHGRKQTNAYMNHLSIASGSLMELETQIRIAQRLGYIDESQVQDILKKSDLIGRKLSALKVSLSSAKALS